MFVVFDHIASALAFIAAIWFLVVDGRFSEHFWICMALSVAYRAGAAAGKPNA